MLKLLMLTHPEGDYLSTFLTAGLTHLANINEYPAKESHYGNTHRYPSPYSPSARSNAFWTEFRTWSGQGEGVTGPYEFMKPLPASIGRTYEQVLDQISTYDVVVLTSPRCWVSAAMCQLIRSGKRLPPCVMVDGEDHPGIRVDYVEAFQPRLYFKREMLWGDEYPAWVKPLPLCSYVAESKFYPEISKWDQTEKEWDVVCCLGNTHPQRTPVTEALQSLSHRYKIKTGRSNCRDHLHALAHAKMGVSVQGCGQDTVRYWEITSFSTLLLTDRLTLVKPHPHQDGESCVVYYSPSDLLNQIRFYLEHTEEREHIAHEGWANTQKNHTCAARAEDFLTELEKVL